MNKGKIWSCTIITYNEELDYLPNGADFPPRKAAVEAIEGLGLSIHSVYSKWGCEEFTPKIAALKRRIAELELLCKECADYLDTNELTNIASSSMFHKQLRQQAKE